MWSLLVPFLRVMEPAPLFAGIRIHYTRFIMFFIGCLLYLAEAVYYDHITDEKIGVNLQEDCNFDSDTSTYVNGSFLPCVRLQ